MRKLLLVGVGLAAMSGSALAADMPVYEPQVPAVASYDWTGFYAGAHGGWGWSETDGDDPVDDIDGFVVGGQIGYNFMWDSILAGLEVDASFSDQNATDGGSDYDVEYLVSVRGRLGFAFDRFLVYGTGGAAFAGADFTDDDVDFFGWVAGAGVEYAITDNVSFGVEYLHYDFGDEDVEVGGGGLFANTELQTDVVRGRLNFRF